MRNTPLRSWAEVDVALDEWRTRLHTIDHNLREFDDEPTLIKLEGRPGVAPIPLEGATAARAEVQTRSASDVSEVIVACAREMGATQIVLGESVSSWIRELVRGSVVRDVLRRTHNVDVHVVPRPSP